MEFPLELRMAIEQKAQGFSTAELTREAQELSRRYREEGGQGKRLSTTDRQARQQRHWNALCPFWKLFPPPCWMSEPVQAQQPGRRVLCFSWNRLSAWNGSLPWRSWVRR